MLLIVTEQIDSILPRFYPVGKSELSLLGRWRIILTLDLDSAMTRGSSTAKVILRTYRPNFRCRPATLYLTAVGSWGTLWVGCWWDGNVYANDLVEEWIDEMVATARFYLTERKRIRPSYQQESQL